MRDFIQKLDQLRSSSLLQAPKSVNNTREDKLATGFWRDIFAKRRCLIPVSEWAEAEGEKGRMTWTWHRLAGQELFAVAGVWRPTAEWGDAYSMVMVDGCEQMAEVHDRMPVVLTGKDWEQWSGGSPEEALALCRTCVDPLTIERTAAPWASARSGDLACTSKKQASLLSVQSVTTKHRVVIESQPFRSRQSRKNTIF